MWTRSVVLYLAAQALLGLAASGSPVVRFTVTDDEKLTDSEVNLTGQSPDKENEIDTNLAETNSGDVQEYERFLRPGPPKNEFREFRRNFFSEISKFAAEANLSLADVEKVKEAFRKNEMKPNGEDRTKWTNDDWAKFEEEKKQGQENIRRACYAEVADHDNLSKFFDKLEAKKEQMKTNIRKASNDHLIRIATVVGLNNTELDRFMAVFEKYRRQGVHWGPGMTDAMRVKNQLQLIKNWSSAKTEFLADLTGQEVKGFEAFFTAVEEDYERRKNLRLNSHRHQPSSQQSERNAQGSDPIADLKMINFIRQVRVVAEEVGLQPTDVETLVEIYEENLPTSNDTDRGLWTEEQWSQYHQEMKRKTQVIRQTALSKVHDHGHLETFFAGLEEHINRLSEVAKNATHSYLREKGQQNGLDEHDIDEFIQVFEKYRLTKIHWRPRTSGLEKLKTYEQLEHNFAAAEAEFEAANDKERNARFGNFFNFVKADLTSRQLLCVVNVVVGWDVVRFGRRNQLSTSEIRDFSEKFEKYSGMGIVWRRNTTREDRRRMQEQFDRNWQTAKVEFLSGKTEEDKNRLGPFFGDIEAQYEHYKLHGCRGPLLILFGWDSSHAPSSASQRPNSWNNHHEPHRFHHSNWRQGENHPHRSFGPYKEESFLRPSSQRNEYREFYGQFSSEVRKLCMSVSLKAEECEKLVKVFEVSRSQSRTKDRTHWTREQWDNDKNEANRRIRAIAFDKIKDSEKLELFFKKLALRREKIQADMQNVTTSYIKSFATANGLTSDEIESFLQVFEKYRREGICWGAGMSDAERKMNKLKLQENWSTAKAEFIAGRPDEDKHRFGLFFQSIENDYARRRFQSILTWYVQGLARSNGLTAEETSDFLERLNGFQQRTGIIWRINMTSEERAKAREVLRNSWEEARKDFLMRKTEVDKWRLSQFFNASDREYKQRQANGAHGPLAVIFGCPRGRRGDGFPQSHEHGGSDGRLDHYCHNHQHHHDWNRRHEGLLLPGSHPREFREFNRNFPAEVRRLAHQSNLSEPDTDKLVKILEDNKSRSRPENGDRTEWTETQWNEERVRVELRKAQVRRMAMDSIEDQEHLEAFFKAFDERKQQMKNNIRRAVAMHLKSIASATGLDDAETDRLINICQSHRTRGISWQPGMTQVERSRNERLMANNWEETKKAALKNISEEDQAKLKQFFIAVEKDYLDRAHKNHQRLPSWARHFRDDRGEHRYHRTEQNR